MDEEAAETEWREGFRARLKQARGSRSQEVMGELLGISQTTYSKYEAKRASQMSIRLLPTFCKICGVSLTWLIEGKEEKAVRARPKKQKRRAA